MKRSLSQVQVSFPLRNGLSLIVKLSLQDEDLKIAKLLLDEGKFMVNLKSLGRMWFHYRGTALQMAVERGAIPYVELFLKYGADADISGRSNILF